MRENSSNKDTRCQNCGCKKDQVLLMFDLKIGNEIITICDECNALILSKTLAAEVRKNAKVKTPRDMRIIRTRAQRKKGIASWAEKR